MDQDLQVEKHCSVIIVLYVNVMRQILQGSAFVAQKKKFWDLKIYFQITIFDMGF